MMMTMKEAGAVLGLSAQKVEWLVATGAISGSEMRLAPHPHWLVSKEGVEAWLAAQAASQEGSRSDKKKGRRVRG